MKGTESGLLVFNSWLCHFSYSVTLGKLINLSVASVFSRRMGIMIVPAS